MYAQLIICHFPVYDSFLPGSSDDLCLMRAIWPAGSNSHRFSLAISNVVKPSSFIANLKCW